MKVTHYLLLLGSCILFSCEKLDIAVPIQIINNDSSSESRYFEERLVAKLDRRKFIIVGYDVPLKMEIEHFVFRTYQYTETVHDDCSGGYNSYTLEEEELQGKVWLTEDGRVLDHWIIEASDEEVLKEDDPLLIQLLFPDDEEKNCTDYWVKRRERMRANLRACARRIAASATKTVNRMN